MKKTNRDWRVGIKVAAAIVERPDTDMNLAWTRDRKMGAATAASVSGGWGVKEVSRGQTVQTKVRSWNSFH